MLILGLSAFYHDSAAALLEDGVLRSAAQQERFSRVKHDAAFPTDAVAFCLEEAGVGPDDLDFVAFYDKPLRKFHRLLTSHAATAPGGYRAFNQAFPLWMRDKLWHRRNIERALRGLGSTRRMGKRLVFADHHQSHAASAFYPSPFDEAAVLTIDGVGEWTTTSLAHGRGSSLVPISEMRFPHSLGLLYAAFTSHLGFKVNSGEYKVMGLAPYGEPRFADLIRDRIIDLRPDGSFRLDMSFFAYANTVTMTSPRFAELFGPARRPEDQLEAHHFDLAASVQAVLEEAVLRLACHAHRSTGSEQLCLAGGVALNCVANGRLSREGPFEDIWIQPAAGDAGGAVGAAYVAYHDLAAQPRATAEGEDGMSGCRLGPSFDNDAIRAVLADRGVHYVELENPDLLAATVDALEAGRAVGWFQGPMEFGPRALGGRSILADPRSSEMQRTLNLRVKHRESFRPFAPSVLAEQTADWFGLDGESPYMLLVAEVAPGRRKPEPTSGTEATGLDRLAHVRSEIPAVTHVDFSARVQTVAAGSSGAYRALLQSWFARTGCPVLVNTSFNVRGEPIVADPCDALRCFLGTDIETLVIGNFVLHKEDQSLHHLAQHHLRFELD